MIVLDTDHLCVLLDERDSRRERLQERLEEALEPIACTIVSLEEDITGLVGGHSQAPRCRTSGSGIHAIETLIRHHVRLGNYPFRASRRPAIS